MTMTAEHRSIQGPEYKDRPEYKERLNQTTRNEWGIYLFKDSTIT